MATFQELMRAATNADRAGDEKAAKMLVDLARKAQGQQTPEPGLYQSGPDAPLTPASSEGSSANVRTGPEPDRFGDTIEAATRGPIAATGAYWRGMTGQGESPTAQAMPEWVPEGVRDQVATAGDAVGTALGGLGTVYSFGAGLAGEVAGGSPTNERKLARDLMMAGQVAVPELSGVSSASIAANRVGRAATNLEAPATATQRGARAADDLGITPSLGAGGKGRAMTAGTLEKVPGAGGIIQRDAIRFVDDVETAFNDVRSTLGSPRTSAEAGATLQEGLGKWVVSFKEKATQLYDRVGEAIPAGTRIEAPETSRMIREAIEPFAENPEIAKRLGLNQWAALVDELEGGLTWQAASDLRTSLGNAIGKMNGPLANMDQGRIKQAYGKLTQDLEAAAKAAGPDAEKAWRSATNYYRRGAERIEKALDKSIKADSPERAFEAFVNMAGKNRASADAKRMWRIKASMPREEWNEMAATIVDRLGRSKPGAQSAAGDEFSPGVFLTEWNKMSDEAKSVLFPQETRAQLNKLAEVSELAKSANAERNFSNSGQVVVGAASGAGLASAPLTTASILLGANISSRALTSTRMLRAMNRAARGDAKQLRTIANGGGPLAQDAQTILRMTAAESAAGGSAANSMTEPRLRANP